jgi:ABC-type multidrug transport system fused ATPase/permease subunit
VGWTFSTRSYAYSAYNQALCPKLATDHQKIPVKFSTLVQYVTPHRRTLFAIVMLLLLESVVTLAMPWIAGQLTGMALGEPKVLFTSIGWLFIAWLALIILKSVSGFVSSYFIGITGETMAAQLRTRVYEHLQILPLAYLQDRKQGDLLTLLSNDSEHISNFVTNTLVKLLPLIATFLGAFLLMAWLDPVIALLAALLLPIYYLAMKIIGRRIRPVTVAWIKSWSAITSLVMENLGLLPAIKAFNRQPRERQRFEERNVDLLTWSKRQILIQSMLTPAIGLLAGAGLLLLLWVGLSHIESGRLEVSGLISLLLYAAMLTQPVSGLANVYGNVMLTRGAAERLLEFFAMQPEPLDDARPNLPPVRGSIEFQDVSFNYPGRPALFRHLNLCIEAHETIALTGPNGAGKSTLAHLLLRFIEPTDGRILIDGIEIDTVSLSSLREQIGLVAQNTLLLNGTVAENIAYGRHEASMEDIKKAAKAARAVAFIEQLPDQFETLIGDQGIRLSGGQRQRLSLARTLLKDPPILILDEATAMLDPEGEQSFIEECHDLLHRRTVILITHRPASLALAARVYKLDQVHIELASTSPIAKWVGSG